MIALKYDPQMISSFTRLVQINLRYDYPAVIATLGLRIIYCRPLLINVGYMWRAPDEDRAY